FSRPQTGDVYFDLLRSIAGQQLSVKAAKTIFGRFENLFEAGYPHPDEVLALELEALRGVGFSRQKSGYIQNVAQFFKENQLETKDWSEMNNEEIVTYLSQIKGVGKWTVQMILMFSVQRWDVLPVDDLGIQNAMIDLYQIEERGRNLKKRMVEIATDWQPYRSVACFYLWRYKDNMMA
ncbi:MAG: DNA-3-methyladenine glycosylase, partial [Saprospiraceae bacterium]